MAVNIQLRRDTAAQWAAINPVLAQGEIGYELDTSRGKIGDGATVYTGLPYVFGSATGDKFYAHEQTVASDMWVVTHGLSKYPSVVVVDSSGNSVEGDVRYDSPNQVTLIFQSEFSGKAYFN